MGYERHGHTVIYFFFLGRRGGSPGGGGVMKDTYHGMGNSMAFSGQVPLFFLQLFKKALKTYFLNQLHNCRKS